MKSREVGPTSHQKPIVVLSFAGLAIATGAGYDAILLAALTTQVPNARESSQESKPGQGLPVDDDTLFWGLSLRSLSPI